MKRPSEHVGAVIALSDEGVTLRRWGYYCVLTVNGPIASVSTYS